MKEIGGLLLALGFCFPIISSLMMMGEIDSLKQVNQELELKKKSLIVELEDKDVQVIVLEQRLQDQLLMNRK